MKSGTRANSIDHRDFDYFKSRRFQGITPTFADNYSIDAGIWVPNQEVACNLFTPIVPAYPYGCTDYAQNELCMDEDGVLYDPSYIESFTHANAQGGANVRDALKVVVKQGVRDRQGTIVKGKHPAFFNIQPSWKIDWFDAIRLAMISTSTEKRGVSIGSPYWQQFGAVGPSGIFPTPDFNLDHATWHNWVVKGWKTIDGQLYIVCQMLQGSGYGDNGLAYMSRQIFNATMAVLGSVAFTIDKLMPGEDAQPIDTSITEWIVSLIRNLLAL